MPEETHDEAGEVFGTRLPQPPTVEQQNWGAVASIIIIVLMIITGAFYAWGKRINEQPSYPAPTEDPLPANY